MNARSEARTWSANEPALRLAVIDGLATAVPSGDWTLANAGALEALVAERTALLSGQPAKSAKIAARPEAGNSNQSSAGGVLTLDFGTIGRLDTVGALLLNRLILASGHPLQIAQGDDKHRVLMEAVNANDRAPEKRVARPARTFDFLVQFGRFGVTFARELGQVLGILGASTTALFGWLTFVRRFRFASYMTHLERTGMSAAPIVALMSFLIGGILAQQGAFYFRRFGADLYVVDLAGMLTLRELGVLLTAIMVAGRSGSAMTAELGSMKMREEIDALRVLGIDPVEVLILPRLLALVTALPILTMIADLAALIGASLDAAAYGGIPGSVFLARLHEAIDLQTFFVGFTKAPFMALIIGLIASLEGLNVKGSTESLGERTTQAVVKSIFFVIVVDGVFAVFFASIGI
jgi:phospholipid/cholesterol/gamma-HCH transport system permease protein